MPEIYFPAEDSYLMLETLSEIIPKLIEDNENSKFLEIGCGSGIQLQVVSKLGIKKKNIFSCDINEEAVKHCKSLGFSCIKSDLFENLDENEKYDIIVFNPPYLPSDRRESKDSQIATTGGKSGSEIINKFLIQAKKHLEKNGKIILLTSSLTKRIKWDGFKKKKISEESLFFEKLFVWELSLQDNNA